MDEHRELPLADFHLLSLEADLTQKTFDLEMGVRLGGLSLFHEFEGEKIHVINTPMAEGKEEYLFVVNMCRVSTTTVINFFCQDSDQVRNPFSYALEKLITLIYF